MEFITKEIKAEKERNECHLKMSRAQLEKVQKAINKILSSTIDASLIQTVVFEDSDDIMIIEKI